MDYGQKKGKAFDPNSIVFNRKLDTALRNSFCNKFDRECDTKSYTIDNWLFQHLLDLHDLPIERLSRNETHLGIIIKKILSYKAKVLPGYQCNAQSYTRIDTLVKKTIEIQTTYFHNLNHTHIKEETLKKMATWMTSDTTPIELLNLLMVFSHMSHLIELSNRINDENLKDTIKEDYVKVHERHCEYLIPHLDILFLWNKTLCAIKTREGSWICPKQIILLIHNKIGDLISVLLLANYASVSTLPEGAYQLTVEFLLVLCNMLIVHKTDFFSIMKVLEGLVIAETLRKHEPWSNREFLRVLTDELYLTLNFSYIGSDLQNFLTLPDTAFVHELGCLSKVLGHPYVDMEKGSEKLFNRTHAVQSLSLNKIELCINHFKKDYIKKTIHKTGKWPPCHIYDKCTPKPLLMSFILNKDPDSYYITSRFGKLSINDYIFVTIDKNKEFNDLNNIVPYLKDKTITLLRSKIIQKYFEPETKIEESWRDTRLLLAYLLCPTSVHDPIRYLNSYKNADDFDRLLDYLVIRIVPKEKELKVAFRGFGCKTFEDRHRCLAQEKNVSLFLEEYSDDQAMTLSELSLLKKLDAFRRLGTAYHNHTILYVVIDATAWNNRFSSGSVDLTMKETLDKIYGTQMFGKTHKSFENTFVYVPDAETIYSWEGQAGGIEGLNQYTWVVAYLNQIKVALEDYPFKYHILCKGDDLRVAIAVPDTYIEQHGLQQIKNNIVTSISMNMQDFGHSINIEESYGSTVYFAFSKTSSLGLVKLPQSYRKIQKCYGANNSFINTLDDYIASTFSNGHSAAYTSGSVICCYAVSAYWALSYIICHSAYQRCNDDQLITLLLTPNMLGGFPIIYLHNFYVRAESDLLSPWVGLLQWCKVKYRNIYEEMICFAHCTYTPPGSRIQLYRDPYSLPITRPTLPSTKLRSYITPSLKKISKNQHLQELIRLSEGEEMRTVILILDSASCIRAKILSAIFNSSPQGVLEELTRKFESGRSVLELLILKGRRYFGKRVLYSVIRAEQSLQTWRSGRFRIHYCPTADDRSFLHLTLGCPAKAAFNIRLYCWGKEIHDITMPPLQHQVSLHYATHGFQDEWINKNHFTLHFEPANDFLTYDRREHFATGSEIPFLGYTTKTGMISPTITFIQHDVLLNKLQALLDLAGWTNQESIMPDGTLISSNCHLLIQKIIKAYTQTPITILAPFAGKRKSGTAQHHMRAPHFKESIVPNMLTNIYTRYRGESNTHVTLRRTAQHYRVNFLHIFTWGCWIGFNELEFSKHSSVPKELWAVTTECEYCNTPIIEEPIVFPQYLVESLDLPTLKLIEIGEIAEDIIRRSVETYIKLKPNIIEDDSDVPDRIYVLAVLQEMFNSSYKSHQKLQDRLTQHSLDAEGQRVLSVLSNVSQPQYIGVTEAKSIPINMLANFLVLIILNHLPNALKPVTKRNLDIWINSVPVEDLPWIGLIRWIYSAGRLDELVRKFSTDTYYPSYGCYNDPRSATRYIGLCCAWYLDTYTYAQELVILAHYTTDSLQNYLTIILNLVRNREVSRIISWSDIKKLEKNVQESPETLRTYRIMIGAAILRYHRMSRTEDQIQDMGEYIAEQNILEIDGIDDSKQDQEDFELFLDENFDISERLLYTLKVLLLKVINLDTDWDDSPCVIKYLLFHYDSFERYLTDAICDSNIKIYYLTLPDAIEKIRQLPRPMYHSDDLSHITTEYDDRAPLNYDRAKLPAIHFLYENRAEYADLIPPQDLEAILVLNLKQCVPFIGSCYQVLGSSNTSPQIIYELMTYLSLKNFPDKHSYICLADGLGGMMSMISIHTNKSRILFHTRPDAPEIETYPSSAIPVQGSNQFVYDYINEGFYDLTSVVVQDRLMSLISKCYLIVCDAEIDADITYLQSYWTGVLNIVIQRSSLNSIFLCQADLRSPLLLAKIIEILSDHYSYIIVYQSKQSSVTYVSYIIALNRNHIITQVSDLQEKMTNPPRVKILHLIYNLISKINKKTNVILNNAFVSSLNLSKIPLVGYRFLIINCGCYAFSLIFRKLGLSVDIMSLEGKLADIVTSRVVTFSMLDKSGLLPTVLIRHYWDSLQSSQAYTTSQTWDTNTQAHRLIICSKLFRCLGYYDCAKFYKGVDAPFIVSGRLLKQTYHTHLSKLHLRDLKSIELRYGSDENYLWPTYIRGVNIFITLFGFLCENGYQARLTYLITGHAAELT